MLKKAGIAVLALLAVLAVVIAFQPASYRVERSTTIAAPAEIVFAQINDFHKWEAWSPWAKLDPQMKVTYDGSASGAGAVYSWAGNSDVGSGRMTILESRPHEAVRIKLEFQEPFASQADTEFRLADEAGATKVTWIMEGESGFLSKAFSLFLGGMDKAIGPDFEKGLRQMKSAVETSRS
jgi:uncharacterized protein YndB with AHSA1/START domain